MMNVGLPSLEVLVSKGSSYKNCIAFSYCGLVLLSELKIRIGLIKDCEVT